MSDELHRRRFTVSEYHRMAEAGILDEDDRVELIEGEIVKMSPIGRKHASHVDRLTRLFCRRLRDRAIVRVQNPIILGRRSEPQPDFSLLRPKPDFYYSGHPGPKDILLALEIADSSLRYDREIKLPLYAKYGIQETWLLIVDRGIVETYRTPGAQGYGDIQVRERGQRIAAAAFPGVKFAVTDLLGPV